MNWRKVTRMRKVALVFVLAVFVPSLVLAWLAVRSLRDQQFAVERQQSLLYQGVADSLAKEAEGILAERQRQFGAQVETLLAGRKPADVALDFDERLRANWPLAEIGFVVTPTGDILSPSPVSRPQARDFFVDYSKFLGNCESAEVYWNPKQAFNSVRLPSTSRGQNPPSSVQTPLYGQVLTKGQQMRNVMPQQQSAQTQTKDLADDPQHFSKIAASEAEFRQLIGDSTEGTLARFVENKLNVLFWYRPAREGGLVFGAQLALPRLNAALQGLMQQFEPAFRDEICVAVLDDKAKPVARSRQGFQTNWKRPFVATEIGETLPHWEAAVYLLDPLALTRSAHTVKWTVGLLISVLVLAIGVGSWLIVADLERQLNLARQKTDFVSNVSHELKTPLTSIRMFSELLAEGRLSDPAKQRAYLAIITAESARLTRLINNVLDFARMERGEEKYQFQACDLVSLARETAETYRPHLEAAGFKFECVLPESEVWVNGDRDALAQVLVNLLSNAEKYSDSFRELALRVEQKPGPRPCVEVEVMDRGLGVPHGCEEKIFDQFFRAHDSLASGIVGSGLGLTLARQIARAHGGDVSYKPRQGGGSCFMLRLPLKPDS